jgi:hypothetical protein
MQYTITKLNTHNSTCWEVKHEESLRTFQYSQKDLLEFLKDKRLDQVNWKNKARDIKSKSGQSLLARFFKQQIK